MSVDLASLKVALRVDGSDDDGRLQMLLESAIQEALRFMGLDELPVRPDDGDSSSSSSSSSTSSELDVLPDVRNAIFLLVQADHDGDPLKRADYERGAYGLLRPYRERIGMA